MFNTDEKTDMSFDLYRARRIGDEQNVMYPDRVTVGDAESLRQAVCRDYVAVEYKGGRRAGSNFILPPSERKSAVLHATVKPADDYEVQYNLRNAPRVEASRMHKRMLEKRQRAFENKAVSGKAEDGELERIAKEIAEFTEEKPLQLYVDDVTTEKLISIMAANHGRAAVISSEGGIFDMMAGMYSRVPNLDAFLKGYSGDTIRVDRIGRESESVMVTSAIAAVASAAVTAAKQALTIHRSCPSSVSAALPVIWWARWISGMTASARKKKTG